MNRRELRERRKPRKQIFDSRNTISHLGRLFESVPASGGNWLFEDNLFDTADIIQDFTNEPLDYAYNGYWPGEPGDLLFGIGELLPTTDTDNFQDGAGELILSNAPPYQFGPFGDFYMPTNTPLFGAGSTNAAVGPLGAFCSTDIREFDPGFTTFDENGAILYATTPSCQNASYAIDIQSEAGQHIRTLTGSTATGVIETNWDLTDDKGNTIYGYAGITRSSCMPGYDNSQHYP